MTAKSASGATRGEGKTGPGTAEMGARENTQPLGGALGGSLNTFFPFSQKTAGISNKERGSRIRVWIPETGRLHLDWQNQNLIVNSHDQPKTLTVSTYSITQPSHGPLRSHGKINDMLYCCEVQRSVKMINGVKRLKNNKSTKVDCSCWIARRRIDGR